MSFCRHITGIPDRSFGAGDGNRTSASRTACVRSRSIAVISGREAHLMAGLYTII